MYIKNYIGNRRAKVNFLGGEPTLSKKLGAIDKLSR